MDILPIILNTIKATTSKTPVVNGGLRQPIEYTWNRIDRFHFMLTIYMSDKNQQVVNELEDKIFYALSDYFDIPKNSAFSVEPQGSGNFVKDNIITSTLKFYITDYTKRDGRE